MRHHFIFIFFLLISSGAFAQNVGVGTPAPLMKLHVSHTDNAVLLLENTQPLNTNISNSLYFKTGSGGYPYTGAIKTIGQSGTEARLGLFTFASPTPNGLLERMSITDDGKIGIGTVSPLKKLHIQVNGTSLLTSAFGDGLLFSTNAASGSRIFLENLNGAVNQKSLAIVNENVGGQGTTYFGSLTDNGGSWVNHLLSMNHANGNVGIGTITPTAKLEVAGGVKISDSIYVGGQVRIISGTPGAGKVLTSNATGVASWQTVNPPTYSIGLHPELGGYVFWVSADGKHGLVAETQDQSAGSNWYLAQDNISNPANHSTNGQKFRDWRMPTKHELNEMYAQKDNIGGFTIDFYWSSTEFDFTNAWYQYFGNGSQTNFNKANPNLVRAVRAF